MTFKQLESSVMKQLPQELHSVCGYSMAWGGMDLETAVSSTVWWTQKKNDLGVETNCNLLCIICLEGAIKCCWMQTLSSTLHSPCQQLNGEHKARCFNSPDQLKPLTLSSHPSTHAQPIYKAGVDFPSVGFGNLNNGSNTPPPDWTQEMSFPTLCDISNGIMFESCVSFKSAAWQQQSHPLTLAVSMYKHAVYYSYRTNSH